MHSARCGERHTRPSFYFSAPRDAFVGSRSSSAAESGARDVILLERLLGTGGKWAQICEVRGTLSDTCNMFWMVTMGTACF